MNLPVPVNQLCHLQLLQQSQVLLQEHISANKHLKQENESLKHQLAWFKQQLFGEKSEKRLIENPDQLALG
uniref:transposase domain-containing protein n=1 Tax=Endozoicomonas sp. ALB115 TaxID=3403074 RepID=UPI003BB7FCCB